MTAADTLAAKASEVLRRLEESYGRPPLVPRREPMHELVSTMLSHRTTGANEDKAFQRMWKRFGSWRAIREAPTADLAEAIAPSTFPEAKAPNIQKTLARIEEAQGDYRLDFLADLPPEEGLAWLTELPGVGVKTASLLLLFGFAKPLLPVDTHLHRVSGRLGLIPAKASADRTHRLLLELLPPDPPTLFSFHIGMLKHGQRVCVWREPRCGRCPLTDLCDWYAEHRA